MRTQHIVSLGLVTLMSACGGGSTGSGGGLANYATQFASLQSEVDTLTFTPAANLPGSATYQGVASFNTTDLASIPVGTRDPSVLIDSLEGYYGGLTLNVNFAGNSLSGSVGDFRDFSGASAGGALTISAGSVTAATNNAIAGGYVATAAGTIDGDAYTFDVDGNFLGDNGEGVSIYFDSTGANEAIGTGLAAR